MAAAQAPAKAVHASEVQTGAVAHKLARFRSTLPDACTQSQSDMTAHTSKTKRQRCHARPKHESATPPNQPASWPSRVYSDAGTAKAATATSDSGRRWAAASASAPPTQRWQARMAGRTRARS